LQFGVEGSIGGSYVVFGSADLSVWLPLTTNTAPFTFTDPEAPLFQRRFYRVRSAP